jgi:hypothetical protein
MPAVPLARTPRWLSVALAVLGAAAFALSVEGGRWWRLGELELGPLGARGCFGGECRSRGLAWLGGDAAWLRSAVATSAGALIAAVSLLALAAGVAAGRRPTLAAKTALVALGTSLVPAALFVAWFPGVTGAAVDRGIYLFAAAGAASLAAAVVVLRAARRSA